MCIELIELKSLSGAVQTNIGIKNLKEATAYVEQTLDKDEIIEKTIKTRDLESLQFITASSAFNEFSCKTNDFSVFDVFFFTNTHIIILYLNYTNKKIFAKKFQKKELLGIYKTASKVEVIDEKAKITPPKSLKISFLVFLIGIFLALPIVPVDLEFKLMTVTVSIFALVYFCSNLFTLKSINLYNLAFKDGTVLSFLIATNNYKDDAFYLKSVII